MSFRGYMLLLAGLVFSGALFSQAQKEREKKAPVDVTAQRAQKHRDLGQDTIVLTGEVVLHHNGAVITCDSAVRYSQNHLEFFRNVIINKDSTYVYGDRAEYNGEINLARVYSPVVKVIDGDATLYTYNFTFNTLSNVGIYFGGGVMYQKDNVMESERGYYYSDDREIVAVRNVQMKNEDYQMVGDSVRYNMDSKIARFYTKSYIWTNEGEILTADRGRYNTQDSTYFFYDNAYVLTDVRETWADTIDYNAKRQDAVLYGNIQIDDDDNFSSGFGDYGQYWGERGETMLTKRPSMMNYNAEQNNNDTLYIRADTMFMYVLYPSDRKRHDTLGPEIDIHAHLRWADSLPDSVRLSIADSLVPVIRSMRAEADSLRRIADSIMNTLYPSETAETVAPPDTLPANDTIATHLLPTTDTLPPPDEIPAVDTLANPAEEAPAEDEGRSRRRRDRKRGPNAEFWFYADTLLSAPSPMPDSVPLVLSRDSLDAILAGLPPISTDTLSAMEKVRELLPDSLSRKGAAELMEMLDGELPAGMSHLVSDSIDLQALKNVITASQEPEPETEPEPEQFTPPEVIELRSRILRLNNTVDSLETAESYIRPKLSDITEGPAVDSLALAAAADSLARLDSIHLADSLANLDGPALKHYRKLEKQRLKAERKAEKRRLREEKRAAKQAERRRRLIAKGRLTDTLPSDSLPAVDSLLLIDSLVAAQVDSLESIRPEEPQSQEDTIERIFRGFYDVKVWRKDMQAVCDSIVGFSIDSTVHMYIDPILWHAESQIVSDSLTLFTDGEYIDRAEFYGNPIMSSKIDESQFNQVTGRTMTSWFRDNEVYRHDIFGNAEAFYYIQEDDDPRPVAFIVATSSNMTFLLEEQFVRYIIARENVQWPVFPIEQIPADQPTILQDFKWLEDRKPELEDVFDRVMRPSERTFHESLEHPHFPIAAKINRRREYLIENRLWADRDDPLPSYAVDYVRSLPPVE